MLEGKLLFHVWPIWYEAVDVTPSDALSFNYAWQEQHSRLGNSEPHIHAPSYIAIVQYEVSNCSFSLPN